MGNFREGYDAGKRMEAEMNGFAKGGKVAVKKVTKPHVPMAKPNVPMPRVPSPRPPVAAPMPPQGLALADSAPGFKAGGKIKVKAHVRAYAKGGAVKKADGGKFIAGAIKKPGALRAELGAKKGEPIPAAKLAKAAKAPGKLGERARFAETLKGMKKAKGGSVHADAKQDAKQIKATVKADCLKGKK